MSRFVFLFSLFIPVVAAVDAQAGLTICNDSDASQDVSIGYKGEEDWTSEGWWIIEPNECATPIGADLTRRYYYLRAEKAGGAFKGEEYYFCTSSEAYTIVGDTDCQERGYEREDFIEIDTGETGTDFTYRLTQAAMDLAQGDDNFGLEFCNETSATQAVSVAYKKGDEIFSEGWWNVEPGKCQKPIVGKLETQFYYYRAEVDAGEFEHGEYSFCTTSDAYTIEGRDACEDRGYVTELFAEIDTGATSPSFSFTLTDQTGGVIGSSQEGLRICNDTGFDQDVSVGFEGENSWVSEGWWLVETGECTDILSGPLTSQFYYYRAEIEGGEFGGDGYFFCTTPEVYSIDGTNDCAARGYDSEDFAEIDIGLGNSSYVLTLVPPDELTEPAETAQTGAGLEVCNRTGDTQQVSFGYDGAEGWTSEGWWSIEPSECAKPELDGVNHRYVYYRAEVEGGPFEGESYFFCTSTDAYTIVGDDNCEARGYDREDFREVDTKTTDDLFTLDIEPSDVVASEEDISTNSETKSDGLDVNPTNETSSEAVTDDVTSAPEVEEDVAPIQVEEEHNNSRRGGSRSGG